MAKTQSILQSSKSSTPKPAAFCTSSAIRSAAWSGLPALQGQADYEVPSQGQDRQRPDAV